MDNKESIRNKVLNKNQGSLKAFSINLIYRIYRGEILDKASSLAYNMLLASVPLLYVFIRGVTMFFPDADRLFFDFFSLLPFEADSIIEQMIELFINQGSRGTVIVSLIAALYPASRGIKSIINAVNDAFELKENRNIFVLRLTAMFYTVALIVIVLLILSLFLINRTYLRNILDNTVFQVKPFEILASLFKLLLTQVFPYIVLTLFLTFFYKTAPATKSGRRVKFSEALVGGIVAGLSSMVVTEIFTWFMTNISNWDIIYGSFATILAFLVWFFLINNIIIIGAQVVACFIEVYKGKVLTS